MKLIKNNLDNIISFLALAFGIYYSFLGPNNGANSFQNWENVSVTTTIVYAIILYGFALFGKEFDEVKKIPKGFIILILSTIVIITIPFSFAFIGEYFKWETFTKIANIIDWNRIDKMWLLAVTALLFFIVDIIVEHSDGDKKIKYHINRKFSETPVLISFGILLVYSYYIGNENIKTYGLESFFAGTVAFQMISSNIIWMFNDDKFWESIINRN